MRPLLQQQLEIFYASQERAYIFDDKNLCNKADALVCLLSTYKWRWRPSIKSTNALGFVFMAWFFPSKSFYLLFCARRLYGHLSLKKTRKEFIYSERIALGNLMHYSCAQRDRIALSNRSMQMENAHQRKTLCRLHYVWVCVPAHFAPLKLWMPNNNGDPSFETVGVWEKWREIGIRPMRINRT